MADKKLIAIGIVVLIVVVVGLVYMSYHPSSNISSNTPGTVSGQGSAVFAITDAAVNMNSISSVDITVNKVEAHSPSDGWITISSTPQTYDLIQLKNRGNEVLLANANLSSGTYNQVRLTVSNIILTDTLGRRFGAKLPSGIIKIDGGFDIAPNMTALASFDFITDKSLHIAGNGEYIFAPVVHFNSTNNVTVNIANDNSINVHGGEVRDRINVGMDANGTVGAGLEIPENETLSIDSNGIIHAGAEGSMNMNSSENSH